VSQHTRFRLRDCQTLREELARLGFREDVLPLVENPDAIMETLGEPMTLGGRVAPNRFLIQPMEGFDAIAEPNGAPGELCFRRYRRYAEGGAGTIWFEATAVLHEGRSNPRQLWLNRRTVDVFARLVEETRQIAKRTFGEHHSPVMILQLTHSGRYSKPDGQPKPKLAHRSKVLDPLQKLPSDHRVISDNYLDLLQASYVEAARMAVQAGFDGVDVKACHRYLVSELLASFTRSGKYGGESLTNRSRMLREVMGRIQNEVPGLFVTTRMNVYDAIPYPYGFGVDQNDYRKPDLREPLELIGQLVEMGIPLLNVSIGNPYYNPHYGRPFDRPSQDAQLPNEHPLAGVVRFIEITRAIQQAYPMLPVVASGYAWLRHLAPAVAAGVLRNGGATLFGLGRNAFAYPNMPQDILTTGHMAPNKACVTCSGCTTLMRKGTMTGCVIHDKEVYHATK